ncbi:MAG: TrkA family potassium uptake protein [Endomicrobiales bacterium]|nr:TrkA family potassium uptake protein [Endomicrobiales bacterium]
MRQIAVLGLGKYGRTVAKELTDKGAQVIAIDENKEKVESIKESVSYAVALNTTDENALKSIKIQDVDIAIVCIGEDVEATLLTTLLLKKMGVKKIWARAINPLQQEMLRLLEIDSIINLEEEMGKITAASLVSVSVSKHIPLASGHSISEIKVPEGFIGKTIRQVDPRKLYNVNIVAVKKQVPDIDEHGRRVLNEKIEDVPSPDMVLEDGDVLLVVGSDQNIEKFSKKEKV